MLTGVLVRPELQCRMGGGDDRRQRKIGFAEEVGAAVLLASGAHEWAHGVPRTRAEGQKGSKMVGGEQLLEELINCGGGSAAKSGAARTESGKKRTLGAS